MSRPVLVAIAGGSGSGKTWLADWLRRLIGPRAALRLAQDDFYRDRSAVPAPRRAGLNYDHPGALDWEAFEAALRDLRAGRPCRLPAYDFATHTRVDATPLEPRPLVIVDGLWLLRRPSVRHLFDLTVFLRCPEPERLRRRLARDIAERARTAEAVRAQFRATVAPMHRRFVEPQARWADVVVDYPLRTADLLRLGEAVWHVLRPRAAALPAAARRWFRAGFRALLPPGLTPSFA
ncbi:MAG TPA: hypothetical protein VEB66_00330 [Opitutaceae bacterium]|nr:hypothetical protein [Opitutaceae bacterium]